MSTTAQDTVRGMAIFGPPTDLSSLIVWIVEKVASNLNCWQPLWQAFELNIVANNPPAAASANGIVYVFYPSVAQDTQSLFYNTCTGTTWSSQQVLNVAHTNTGAGAAAFGNQVYVFWQGASLDMTSSPNGTLYYCIIGQDYYWQIQAGQSIPGHGAGVIMSGCPQAVVFNSQIYVFYQGPGNDQLLWYTQSSGGADAGWSASTQVPAVAISTSPATTVFTSSSGEELLYVFHQGGNSNGQLWRTVMHTDGSWEGDVQVPDVSMTGVPGATVWDGTIYVFYEGGGSNGQSKGQFYNVCSTDGSTWSGPFQVLPIAIAGSPAVAVFNGQLVCMMQSTNNSELAYTIINPGNSSPWMSVFNGTPLIGSPGITVFNDQLLCFYQEQGGAASYFICEEAQPRSLLSIGSMSGSPAPVVFNNNLYVFFQTSDGLKYMYTSAPTENWSGMNSVPNLFNPTAPGVVTFGDNLYLFYTYNEILDGGENAVTPLLSYTVASLDASGQLDWAPPVSIPLIDRTATTASEIAAGLIYGYDTAPAAVVFNETLYVFFLARGPDYVQCVGANGIEYCQIFCSAFSNGSFGTPFMVSNTTSTLDDTTVTLVSVAVTSYDDGNGNLLYCIFQDGSGNLYYMSTANPGTIGSWSAPVRLGGATAPTSSPPGAITELADLSIGCVQMILG